jgi:DMSO/TMAO reductase YedYZ molybdopterin-dependent catalytic subunit
MREEEQAGGETPRDRDRRRFLLKAAAGAGVVVIGGILYALSGDDETRAAAGQVRPDGRQRLPPGQHLIRQLRPMGGREGDPSPSQFRLKVYGEVRKPLEIDYAELMRLPQVEQTCDVHCVTKWSVLDSEWKGVQVAHLAELAGVKDTARHVIFEAAQDYTANVRIEEALQPNVLVAHRLEGEPLPLPHGPPVRALVPDLYFWKSAKWLTGIRFNPEDEPGYWEVRGYNNHADPWREERYA